MKNINSFSMAANSRRAFLKKTVMATLPLSVLKSSSLSGQDRIGISAPIIRMRPKPQSIGWKYYRTRTVADYLKVDELEAEEGKKSAESKNAFNRSQYGGNSVLTLKATGKFRTEKVDGRWWLVDPDGHPFLSCGINTVSPSSGKVLTETINKNGGEQTWGEETVRFLRSKGFNTMGYWSKASGKRQEQTILKGMPYVFYGFARDGDLRTKNGGTVQGLMKGFAFSKGVADDSGHPIFHRDFAEYCQERCKMIDRVKDDPWLIGYFTDNELRFMSLTHCLAKADNDPIYGDAGIEARRWLMDRGRNARSLNSLTEEDNRAWMGHVFEWYYRVTTRAVRQYDTDHLLLGTRIFSVERNFPEVFAAAGKYLDVISLNPYGMAVVTPGQLRQWSKWAGDKPLMIGEFYVKGLDVELANTRGAGFVVASQEERGWYYQNYVLSLLQSGVCVGWSWHRYADDEGVKLGADLVGASNKGVFSCELKPYEALLSSMEELNLRMYELVDRMGSV